MPRKSFTLLVLLLAGLGGSLFYRRRSARRLERVELYADDGAMVSLPDDSVDFEGMLGLARDVVSLPG